jgi:hypothetical protein
MNRRLCLQALLTVPLVMSCLPEPLDVAGRRCSATRPCGPGFECVNAQCRRESDQIQDGGFDAGVDGSVVDAGADAGQRDAGFDGGYPVNVNLLANGGFELLLPDGGVRFWRPFTVVTSIKTSTLPRNASFALEARSATGIGTVVSEVVGTRTSVGMLFCTEAWARVENGTGTLSLTLFERYPDGGSETNSPIPFGLTTSWTQVRESYFAFGQGPLDVRLTARHSPDASIVIDDVALYRAPGFGPCASSP